MASAVATGGALIVFVPAFMFLWSQHDEANNHFRRYRRPELNQLLAENGFTVTRSSYWNFLLFLPVAVVRFLKRRSLIWSPKEAHGDFKKPTSFMNRLLFALLRCENRQLCLGINWPWGVSVMALGQKTVSKRT